MSLERKTDGTTANRQTGHKDSSHSSKYSSIFKTFKHFEITIVFFYPQIIAFLSIWMPYACLSLAEAAGYKITTEFEMVLYSLILMLTKASVCLNPVIYIAVNNSFWNAVL